MLEIERKFEADDDLVLPDLGRLGGVASVTDPEEHLLVSTYFDTPDLRLYRRGVTLRRRTGGTDSGWHLKLPAADEKGERYELQLPPGRASKPVPRRFRTTLTALAAGRELVPVATIVNHRTVRLLLDESGGPLAELADDRVEAARIPEEGEPSRWRELEVELKGGDRGLLDRAGRRLLKAGAHRSPRRSKLDSLLQVSPSMAVDAPTHGRDPVSALLTYRLASQVHELLVRDPLAREDLPEGVHAMRVATRRLRSALATGRPYLDRTITDPLSDEVAWLCDVLGAARDTEVMRDRLDLAIAEVLSRDLHLSSELQGVRRALLASLDASHQRALRAMRRALVGRRYLELLDGLHDLVADPPWLPPAHESIRHAYVPRVHHDLERLRRRMVLAQDAGLETEARGVQLHRARRAAKRARYALEPLRPVYGEPAAALVQALKDLQTDLGSRQDTVVTRTYLLGLTRTAQPALDPIAAVVVGALVEREARDAEHYEAEAMTAWHAVSAHERFA